MAKIKGEMLICDRCDGYVFLEYLGKGEADGGYTTWDKFEKTPEGWGFVEGHNLCPNCMGIYNNLMNEFLYGK